MSPTSTARLLIGASVLSAFAALSTAFLLGRAPSDEAASPAITRLALRDRQITVTGRAEQKITPDRATLSFSVVSSSKVPSAAQLQNESATARVIAALKSTGANDSEINPRGLSITTEERSEQNPQVPLALRTETIAVKYTVVSTDVTVVTNKLGSVGKMVRGAFDAGASTGSVEFSSSKVRKLADNARAAAMKAAVEKAEAMSKAAGATRGSVISIGLDDWSPMEYRSQGRVELNRQNVSQEPGGAGSASMNEQFGGGMISVSATVNASFEIVVP